MDDFKTARICSLLANINRNPKKKSAPFTPQDFMVRKKKKAKQTPEDMLRIVKQWHALAER